MVRMSSSEGEDEEEEVVRISSSEEDEDEGEESDSGERKDEDSGEGEGDSGEGDSDEEEEENEGEESEVDEESEGESEADESEGEEEDEEVKDWPIGDFANRARDPPPANNQRPRKRHRAGNGVDGGRPCPYKQRCRAFLDSLNLNEEYFEAYYDRCYCRSCAAAAGVPEVLETDRAHGCPYEVPIGWCGFGLKVKPTAAAEKVFEKWAVSFHGCPSDVISSILRQGELLIPGDKMIDGTKLANRLTGGSSNRIGLYTSPSIKYSELDIYTKPRQWSGSSVRTVIQCRQKPGTFEIKDETIGWTSRFGAARFSEHFSNARIERFTKARGSIIPYRVLVALDVTTREHEEEAAARQRQPSPRRPAPARARARGHPPIVPIHRVQAGGAAAAGDLQVCQGNHWVSGGCENEACRNRRKCVATCTRCPDRIRAENRSQNEEGCAVM